MRSLRSLLLLSVAVCVALPASPQQVNTQITDALTPAHVAQLRTVEDVWVSPDGESMVYTLGVPRRLFDEDDGSSWRELHWIDARGVHRPLITGPGKPGTLAWSPDGDSLTFLDKRDGDDVKCLYHLPLTGGEASRLLCHDNDIREYQLHPDGRIAFVATDRPTEKHQRFLDAGFTQEVFEEDYSFDRVWIATPVDADCDDYGCDDTPRYERRLLEFESDSQHVSDIAWSPVDSRLVVALAPTPLVDDELMQRRVHVIDADTGEIVVRVANPGKLKQVSFAPDGRHVAMISAADISDPRESRLMVAQAQAGSDGSLRDLTPRVETKVTEYAWTGGGQLVLIGDEDVHTRVYRVAADGSSHDLLADGRASWSDIAASKKGDVIGLVGDRPEHPAELYRLQAGDRGSKAERLTDSNPWLAELRLAPQEVVTWKARDGMELRGILIRPLDEEPGRRYPVIMVIHGGPEAHVRDGWSSTYSRLGQMAAARGFAVFLPNYRGSTGRGVDFQKLGHKDFAGKEFDDIVDAIDHLAEIGLADPERIGITGASYGGYASAWGATYYTERFAAAVMMVGLSDLVAALGTTDIPKEDQLVHKIVWPWQDWNLYRERSPLTYVEQARTPILIMGGTSDPRVHPTQSQTLHRYLKLIGETPVRYVRYDGEPHGNSRAASRFDYTLRALRWFEHYLQGVGLEADQRDDDLRKRPLPPFELDYEAALN